MCAAGPWLKALCYAARCSSVIQHLLCFAWQDPAALLTGNAQGYPVGQIFYDVFKVRAFSLAALACMAYDSSQPLLPLQQS